MEARRYGRQLREANSEISNVHVLIPQIQSMKPDVNFQNENLEAPIQNDMSTSKHETHKFTHTQQ